MFKNWEPEQVAGIMGLAFVALVVALTVAGVVWVWSL